ncbi:MAG: HD domain-containing protein [Chloroflexota bacterium]
MTEPWRPAVKNAMHQAAQNQAGKRGKTFNYRWEHVQAVVNTAVKLAGLTDADPEIVEASAWLHDIRKETKDIHPQEGAKFARQFLPQTDFPVEKIEAVASAIEQHMGLWLDEPLENLEAQVLWDADKLTKIGATIIFHFTGNWLTKNKPVTTHDILENGRSVDWIPKTVASMHTQPAKVAAAKRYKAFQQIWGQLAIELENQDLEAPFIHKGKE